MRHGMRWLAIALPAMLAMGVAIAGDSGPSRDGPSRNELAAMNAASAAWDRFVATSSQDDPEAAVLLAPSSIEDYAFVRDAALYASPEQVRRLPATKRLELYALRAGLEAARIATLDGEAVARHCIQIGLCGIAAPEQGENPIALSHVTLVTPDLAVGELGPPTGSAYQFGPELVRVDGEWKVRIESLVLSDSASVALTLRQSGLSETELLEFTLGEFLPDDMPTPSLALLDRPLRDDGAMRTALNERWPRYESTYRTRVLALERKAESGEDMAQYALGAVLYAGTLPEAAPRDRERGLALMEQASDAGNAQAAAVVVGLLTGEEGPDTGEIPSTDYLERLARHARRAAEAGDARAMSAIGNLTFNGAAGIARDCRAAEEWLARAEDAGLGYARNERVWFLAACPIPEQRDPERAMALARHLIEQADTLSPFELDTIAATFAANGLFEDAVRYQTRAIAGIDADAGETLAEMKERGAVYARGQDWVQDYSVYERAAQ